MRLPPTSPIRPSSRAKRHTAPASVHSPDELDGVLAVSPVTPVSSPNHAAAYPFGDQPVRTRVGDRSAQDHRLDSRPITIVHRIERRRAMDITRRQALKNGGGVTLMTLLAAAGWLSPGEAA